MFINVGLGWILDLCPGRTALRRLGWLELRGRKLLPAFWPSVRDQTSDGQERRAGREGGKVQDVLAPTSCGVEEPGKAA